VAVITNAMGAGEIPAPWMLELAAGLQVLTIGDADRPGDEGAARWALAFARHAAESKQVRLPYSVVETHGKDLRDWLNEGHGWVDLFELAGKSPAIEQADEATLATVGVIEADDDPHRLARVNLEKYRSTGRNLVNYKGDFLAWKRGCYRHLENEELRYKLTASIKEEFDRLNLDAQQRFKSGQEAGLIKADEQPPKAFRVTPGCVTSVMQATASMTLISSATEQPAWIAKDSPFPAKEVIATENGIIHLPSLIAGLPSFAEPTPDFFSRNCLPYTFEAEAKCPLWEKTLTEFWPGDEASIKTLQEWFGYCLTPDTSHHKLLMLVGPPRSG
jgi:putative DNA primase/helicase